ncbi:matrilin-1-like [Alosa pseudoharengus]|uniref:matrilin-1-like n=1 Tax=Alosa pseudoharengus TaxID=34774 RepID=UPI003F8A40DD
MIGGIQFVILLVTTAIFSVVENAVYHCRNGQETTQSSDGTAKSSGCSLRNDYFIFAEKNINLNIRSYNNNNNNNNNNDPGKEIAFVLDGSGSIDPPDFELAKRFIADVMTTVWSKCFNCKFAVVQYGDYVKTELSLKENDNRAKALTKVAGIKQITKVTITASAINHVLEHIFVKEDGSNDNSKKYIIMITDGRIYRDNMTLTEVLQNPKMKDITRFAIGVGPDVLNHIVALEEMRSIASDPDEKHFFKADDYKALPAILDSLQMSITGLDDPGKEIAFVLDGSGSIDPPDFELAKQFIADVMTTVWSTCFNCKFAVVQYGYYVKTELSLKENDNITKALTKVAGIKQITKFTITASAINHVLEHVFVKEDGSNENSKKCIIVITDGRIFMDAMNLTEVLQNPKIENITRFVIGVGPEVLTHTIALKEMREIASDPDDEHFFKLEEYSALETIVRHLQLAVTGIDDNNAHQQSFPSLPPHQ